MMMAILSSMFAINSDASSAFGSSKRFTILLQELSCFVLRILISLSLREKKAILDPETINDKEKENKDYQDGCRLCIDE